MNRFFMRLEDVRHAEDDNEMKKYIKVEREKEKEKKKRSHVQCIYILVK